MAKNRTWRFSSNGDPSNPSGSLSVEPTEGGAWHISLDFSVTDVAVAYDIADAVFDAIARRVSVSWR
jgi:hypothetical protein